MSKWLQHVGGLAVIVVLASCGGGGGSGGVTAPGPLAQVAVSAPTTTVIIGSTLQLTATPQDASGHQISGLTVTWTSSNTAAATVSSSGLVSGVAAGATTITATVSGISGTASLNVTTAPATATVAATPSLQFTPPQVDIAKGGTVTFQFGTITHNVTYTSTGAGTPSNITDTANNSVTQTFTTAGTFTYHCTLHVGMNGTVVVH